MITLSRPSYRGENVSSFGISKAPQHDKHRLTDAENKQNLEAFLARRRKRVDMKHPRPLYEFTIKLKEIRLFIERRPRKPNTLRMFAELEKSYGMMAPYLSISPHSLSSEELQTLTRLIERFDTVYKYLHNRSNTDASVERRKAAGK